MYGNPLLLSKNVSPFKELTKPIASGPTISATVLPKRKISQEKMDKRKLFWMIDILTEAVLIPTLLKCLREKSLIKALIFSSTILLIYKMQRDYCKKLCFCLWRCLSFSRGSGELGKEYSCLALPVLARLFWQRQSLQVEEPPFSMYQQVAWHQNGKANPKNWWGFYFKWLNFMLLQWFSSMKLMHWEGKGNKARTKATESK